MRPEASGAEAGWDEPLAAGWQRLAKPWAMLLALLLVAAALVYADTRDNGFPYFYHPDEPDKVDQVLTQKWNFHHPLLMLGTAELVKNAMRLPDREQEIVVMGRWLSALFAAAGVAAYGWLAYRVRGVNGLALALLLAFQHQIFELAHYFKEDSALFFAMGLAWVAIHFYWRRGTALAAGCAGAACGLCLSAKYLGAIMLVPAMAILLARQRRNGARPWHWVLLAVKCAAVAVLINWPMLRNVDLFRHSFGREATLVAHSDHGYLAQFPLFEYLRIFVANTNPVVWVLLAAELIAHWRARRERDAFDWVMLVFPFAFTLLLSCSTKTNDRYFLPATAGFYYLAALGAIDLPGLLRAGPTGRQAIFQGMLFAAILAGGFSLRHYLKGFQTDDRGEMLAWIRQNVPPEATIAAEDHADLPTPDRPERLQVQPLLPQKVIQTKYAANLGDTPGALAARGIDFLVVSESDYGLFFRKAAAHLKPELQRKKDFYERLFVEAKPLQDYPRGTVIYLHPGLRLYALKGLP